jgi:hypothetical protein
VAQKRNEERREEKEEVIRKVSNTDKRSSD